MSTLFDMGDIPEKSTGDNEWYTPSYLIEAARKVMGSIYLDPASCPEADQTVKASRIYTKDDDGLSKPWAGPLWLNPPYGSVNGRSNMAIWSTRLIEEHKQGNVAQAVLLCMPNTEASWFQSLWEYPICFPCPRVMFHRPNGKLDHHIQGTCFIYFGPNISSFVEHFTEFGPVVTPDGVHRRPQPLPQPTLWDKEVTG